MNDDVLKKDTKYILDLGKVGNIAEIVLNGQVLPIQWKPPYRADVTPWLHAGKNELQIKITNLWPNRLIGDQFLPAEQRYAFTNIAKFTKASPLLESGLLGPVSSVRPWHPMHEIDSNPLPPAESSRRTGNRPESRWQTSQSPLSMVDRWMLWRLPQSWPSTGEM